MCIPLPHRRNRQSTSSGRNTIGLIVTSRKHERDSCRNIITTTFPSSRWLAIDGRTRPSVVET